MHLPACENQRDGNNGQRPGELDHCGALEHIGAGMHAVPGARRSRYRRGVVDGGAGKQAKALVGQPEHSAERRKHERRDNVKQEDDRNGLGNLAIVGIDDGRGRSDGRTAANRRTHTHKRRDLTRYVHDAAEHKGDDKRGRDRRHDNRQRLGALGQNLGEVHAKAKQDNRVLQDFFGRIGDAGGELFATLPGKDERQDHAKEDGKYRTADHLNLFAEHRRGNGNDQAEQDAFPALANDICQLHMGFLLSISRLRRLMIRQH